MEDVRRPEVLPHLMALLQEGQGSADERIGQALDVLVEELDVHTAFVSRFVDGQRVFTHLAGVIPGAAAAGPSPVEETVCRLIASGEVAPLVPDTATHPLLNHHPHITAVGIGAYLGVPLVVGGEIVGAVCAIAAEARPLLTERDIDRLATIGEYVGQVLTRAEDASAHRPPRPRPEPAPAEQHPA